MDNFAKLWPLLVGVRIILYVILSWVLVHVFAVSGVFLVIAYPIWWMFFPKLSICFSCRFKKEGEYCQVCKHEVSRQFGSQPKNFRSVAYNALLILLVTIISVLIVYFELRALNEAGFFEKEVDKSVSFSIPSKGQYRLEEIFPVKIDISGVKTPINVVQADLSFNPDKVEVVEVSIKDSFAKVFLQKQINNDIGYVRLTGGLPSPGLTEAQGTLGTVYFKAKSSGLAQIKFLPSSMVLANDGNGTNVADSFPEVSYLITTEKLSTEEQALQNDLLDNNVLGVVEDDEKLIFFGNGTTVLGATDSVNREDEIEKDSGIELFVKSFLLLLAKIDTYIISTVTNVFSKV
ncbi:hypothetical protein HYV12_02805 [Candidatus Dojkabacteria bacterium]|nr:hypothetical protein [Candidatus Dojkabacteria bacterium]